MKIKHQELFIPTGDPFHGCVLDRKKYAAVLSEVLKTYSDGFVLALNSQWGTGKTTFVRMWQQYLKNEGFATLYFNSWENDFDTNPLTALLAELKNILPSDKQIAFNKLLKKSGVLAQNVLPALAKAVAKKYIDIEEVSAGIEGLTKAATELLKDEIKSYTARQKGLVDFKEQLQQFVGELGTKPFVFFIDELDRCKPAYAVELLEQIKHFFSVPGIVFVLSIDKVQLGHCIRGAYGSEALNTEEYLKRFIDLEFTLPEPDEQRFCTYLFNYFSFGDFFDNNSRKNASELKLDGRNFIDFSASLFKGHKLTLRQQEKLFAHARVGLLTFEKTEYVFPSIYLLLLFGRTFHNQLYTKLRRAEIPLRQVLTEIREWLPSQIPDNQNTFYEVTQSLFFLFYLNHYRNIKPDDKALENYKVESLASWPIFPTLERDEKVLQRIGSVFDKGYRRLSLTVFFDHIELINELKPA
ncbi:MAG: hypothetical protein DI535_05990 [Citrobacter freundii]|nr:MAG: hypothetical protein DI535_05990 [Citrobacter freundii]